MKNEHDLYVNGANFELNHPTVLCVILEQHFHKIVVNCFWMQMLQAVSNIAPRGVYVCGNATSSSGLTVSKAWVFLPVFLF